MKKSSTLRPGGKSLAMLKQLMAEGRKPGDNVDESFDSSFCTDITFCPPDNRQRPRQGEKVGFLFVLFRDKTCLAFLMSKLLFSSSLKSRDSILTMPHTNTIEPIQSLH